jgi:hypothetical protein
MELNNSTPFSPFIFESLEESDKPIHVVVCRGTFDIVNGGKITLSPIQEPVVLADQYRKSPLISSVQVDSELVPKKYAADVTLNAVATAPHGKSSDQWKVAVTVGKSSKSLNIVGPRFWEYSVLGGWKLTSPEAIEQLPIHYELAFGGTWVDRTKTIELPFEPNPIGIGFAIAKDADRTQRYPAPNVEDPSHPVRDFGRIYSPVGLGPIAKHWLPRRELCGTADDHWKESRWPLRPRDFDFRYYNCAPKDQIYPGYLIGNEDIVIDGCSAFGSLNFALPHLSIALVAVEGNRKVVPRQMILDTLHIDLQQGKCFLTWRATFEKTNNLIVVYLAPCSL